MAILTFAAPVSGLRGKVGGVIFSANKAGPFLKAWGRGSNPRSQRQTNHRNDLVQFAQSWADITAAQKTAWDVYGLLAAQELTNPLGENYFVSGFAWFVTLNIARRQNGQAQLSPAPILSRPGSPVITNFVCRETGSPSTTRFQLDPGSPDLAFVHAIKSRIFSGPGHSAQAEIKTFMIVEVFTGTRQFVFQDELELQFGTIQINQNCFATIQAQNSEGRRGTIAAASALAIP